MRKQNEIRTELINRLLTKRDQAKICGVHYSTYTRFINGMDVNEVTLKKINIGLNKLP